ncbi:MAG: IS481 family transposase [Armatimonadota bacterium]|nr:IS481 family transposase [Armatimonadota bacterium]
MPWRTVDLMALRYEFVTMARQAGVSVSALCRRFQISRKTGYKWLGRYRQEGVDGLADRSRRPHALPAQVSAGVAEAIVTLRTAHPTWGARKILRALELQGIRPLPAGSTITAVLHRQGLIATGSLGGRRTWQRFTHPVPNSLWQMDFKRPVVTLAGRAHPLTILDDCSRFNLCLHALPHQRTPLVQATLTGVFQRYGLPDGVLVDNGSPWGSDAEHVYTPLGVWLLRLGIRVRHSRAYHPQTLGKEERFHRTLEQELLAAASGGTWPTCRRP